MSTKTAEGMTCLYLRTLSFEQVCCTLGIIYNDRVLSKKTLIKNCEYVADSLPSLWEVSAWLKPKRSGYYALDGTWVTYRGEDRVLLILYDVETLDVVSYCIALEEEEESYRRLMDPVREEIGTPKGFFCDGDTGLLAMLKRDYVNVPIQLCVFHKYSRAGQVLPFVRPRTEIDKQMKALVEKVLFAPTKADALSSLEELRLYAADHAKKRKVQTILALLEHNFDLLLTHFDNPDMHSRYNNTLEGFNAVIKRKTCLMRGFKKEQNVDRWIKLILLDWRFHSLHASFDKARRGKSPLQLGGVTLPKLWNWINYVTIKYPKKKVAKSRS